MLKMRSLMKLASVAVAALVVILALGPAKWAPRSGLGFEVDHFLGYFIITTMFCLAWPRPFVVGGALIVGGVLLEALQALTPDRSANSLAALCGASGALAAALLAAIFIRIIAKESPEVEPVGDLKK